MIPSPVVAECALRVRGSQKGNGQQVVGGSHSTWDVHWGGVDIRRKFLVDASDTK